MFVIEKETRSIQLKKKKRFKHSPIIVQSVNDVSPGSPDEENGPNAGKSSLGDGGGGII